MLASVAAVAGAFLLVMLFEAVYEGESEQIVAYVDHVDADLWIMQRGVANMHMATSYLADWKLDEVAGLPGVQAVEGILYLNAVIRSGDSRWFAYIVGLGTPSRLSGPWDMAAGRDDPEPGEAVVPEVFAALAGLKLGDAVQITDRQFEIVGFSRGTFSMANSVVFIAKTDLEDMMSSLDITSYGLVKAEPGVDPDALAERIEAEVDKVHALPAERFVRNDRQMALQMGVETIATMTLIGGALAILLVAFTVYSRVSRQRRELAVVKALGVSNVSLYACISLQAVVITLLSGVVATGLALAIMPMLTELVAAVTLKLTPGAVVRVAVVGVFVSVLASLIPARQIARVDPLSAFKA